MLTKRKETIKESRIKLEDGLWKDFKPNVIVSMIVGEGQYEKMTWDLLTDDGSNEDYNQLCDLGILLFGMYGKNLEDLDGEQVDIITYKDVIVAIGKDDYYIIPYWILYSEENPNIKSYYKEDEAMRLLEEIVPKTIGE